jgi:K+-transporting ATPase A subunit
MQLGGNMEGKESRFGIGASALFATITTGTSCGAVNAMHDSFMPLGGFAPLFNMMLARSCSEVWERDCIQCSSSRSLGCLSPGS